MFGFKQPPPPPPVRVQIVSEDALLLTFFAAGVLLIISLAPLSEPGKISARRVYSLSAALLAASTLALTAFEPNISAIDSFCLDVRGGTTDAMMRQCEQCLTEHNDAIMAVGSCEAQPTSTKFPKAGQLAQLAHHVYCW